MSHAEPSDWQLAKVAMEADELQAAREAVHTARRALAEAIVAAHTGGHSYGVLGRLLGVSRQRAEQLAGGKQRGR